MAAAVRIGVQGESGWLGFDLAQVMAVVGPQPHLNWVLREAEFNGDVRTVWPADWEVVQRQSDQPRGVPLDWVQMTTLAQQCQQIIDGRFTAYDESGQVQLQMQAVDSSFWVVWARDEAVLERVRGAFAGVEDYEERTPAPRGTTID
ncbi:hypothetical protein [Jannaschia sp. R86511]|uniref:hypothetical protein n=1 Tax=Jannaschia sp. R86511 TaxID=3093853 RepID=UPI0036D380FB